MTWEHPLQQETLERSKANKTKYVILHPRGTENQIKKLRTIFQQVTSQWIKLVQYTGQALY